jgi:hypothetical protein
MDPNRDSSAKSPKTHFHIRWSGVAVLDWERFNTRAEATACALELARPREIFSIEESDGKCARCGDLLASQPDDQDSVSN